MVGQSTATVVVVTRAAHKAPAKARGALVPALPLPRGVVVSPRGVVEVAESLWALQSPRKRDLGHHIRRAKRPLPLGDALGRPEKERIAKKVDVDVVPVGPGNPNLAPLETEVY